MIDLFSWLDWAVGVGVGALVLLIVIIGIMYFSMGRKPDKPSKRT